MIICERKLADIRALNEDRGNKPIVAFDRLIDEVEDALFHRPVFMVAKADLHALASIWHAGRVNMVQMFEKLVSFEFGKGLRTDFPIICRWPISRW